MQDWSLYRDVVDAGAKKGELVLMRNNNTLKIKLDFIIITYRRLDFNQEYSNFPGGI